MFMEPLEDVHKCLIFSLFNKAHKYLILFKDDNFNVREEVH